MQFDDALKQLTEARTNAAELEAEFGARPQFTVISDALRNFETVLKEATDLTTPTIIDSEGNDSGVKFVDTGDELAIPVSDILDPNGNVR